MIKFLEQLSPIGVLFGGSALVISNDAPRVLKIAAYLIKPFMGGKVGVCDGTNDETQINEALDALISQGGIIQLSSGDFNVDPATATISMGLGGSADWLRGEGRQATRIVPTSNGDVVTIWRSDDDWAKHCKVSDIGFVDTAKNYTGAYIKERYTQMTIIRDCLFWWKNDAAVRGETALGTLAENNWITYCGKASTYAAFHYTAAASGSGNKNTNIKAKTNVFEGCKYGAFFLEDMADGDIDNNFSESQDGGIIINVSSGGGGYSEDIRVHHNYLYDSGGTITHFIYLIGGCLSDHNVMRGAAVGGGGGKGIYLGDMCSSMGDKIFRTNGYAIECGGNSVAIGDYVYQCHDASYMVCLSGGNANIFIGNRISEGDASIGIRVVSGVDSNIICNNRISRPISVADSNTSNIIMGNNDYIAPGEIRYASGSLTAGVANTIAFAWHNVEDGPVFIKKVIIEVTTAGGTAGSHLDVGIADDATGTNRGTEFFDDLLLNTAQVNDSWLAGDGGTQTKWVFCDDRDIATNGWVVGQILDANAASLVGKYYIEYVGR